MHDAAAPFLRNPGSDNDPVFAGQAVAALSELGDAAMPGLVDALEHPDRPIREQARDALLENARLRRIDRLDCLDSQQAVLALAALLPMTRSRVPAIRRRVFVGVVNYGGPRRPEALLGLRDRDAQVRRAVCESLGCWGSEAKTKLIPLAECLQDADESVRLVAAETLWIAEQNAGRLLPTVLRFWTAGTRNGSRREADRSNGEAAKAAAPRWNGGVGETAMRRFVKPWHAPMTMSSTM